MNDDLNNLKRQHINNYKNVSMQMILNNNNSLFDEDIMSLIKKPPLDSMDVIKNKLISLTKKENIILDSINYEDVIEIYRDKLLELSNKNKELRFNVYSDIVNSFSFDNYNNEVIKILKKDTTNLDKFIRKNYKDGIVLIINDCFGKDFNKLLVDCNDKDIIDDIYNKFYKYMTNDYLKQLLDNIDIKILVKDTILINSFKEEGEKYLYTLNNSHLFD